MKSHSCVHQQLLFCKNETVEKSIHHESFFSRHVCSYERFFCAAAFTEDDLLIEKTGSAQVWSFSFWKIQKNNIKVYLLLKLRSSDHFFVNYDDVCWRLYLQLDLCGIQFNLNIGAILYHHFQELYTEGRLPYICVPTIVEYIAHIMCVCVCLCWIFKTYIILYFFVRAPVYIWSIEGRCRNSILILQMSGTLQNWNHYKMQNVRHSNKPFRNFRTVFEKEKMLPITVVVVFL